MMSKILLKWLLEPATLEWGLIGLIPNPGPSYYCPFQAVGHVTISRKKLSQQNISHNLTMSQCIVEDIQTVR